MKTSKRILGAALALIMIFNVFAVGTFAAGTESAVDLYLSTDKEVYAAGDEIVLTVSAKAIDAVGNLRIGGGYAFGYNAAAIKPYSDAVDLDSHAVTAIQAGYDSTISTTVDKSMDSLDAKGAATYGWTDWIILGLADDGVTSFSASEKTDLFTFKMKIADDAADGTYTIGFNQASYENYNGYINDTVLGGIYGYADDYGYGTTANYGFNNVTIKVGKAEEKVVKHADTMAQWADKDAGLINVGLVGKFSAEDIAIKFSDGTDGKIAGQSTNVTAVGAKVTINGTTKDKTTNYVYDVNGDGSEFWFRAVVENVPYNAVEAAGEISVVYYVVMDGETYESDAYTTTVAEVYAEATGNGMPAFGA